MRKLIETGEGSNAIASPDMADDAPITWRYGLQARTCRIPRAGLWLGAL